MNRADIAVIGGGLAGAAFALELARTGRAVTLFEKSTTPHHKVCGEFLSGETCSALKYLGIDVSKLGASTINRLRVVSGEKSASARLPFQASGLSRYRLDETLLDLVRDAGAEVRRGETVTGLELRSDGVNVCFGDNAVFCSTIALATGKHSLRGHSRARGSFTGFKIQLEVSSATNSDLQDLVQLVIYDGGYIGACFVEGGLVTICWLFENRILKEIGTDWLSHCNYLSRQSTLLGDLLSGAKPQWEKPVAISGMPFGYLRQDAIAPNVYPVGDQLAVIPSYTGDGMAIALYSGIEAARALIAGRGAAEYQAQMIGKLRPQFRMAHAANLLFETALTRRIGIGVSRMVPQFMTIVAKATRLKGFEL